MAGIVVAAEHEETLREAIAKLEQQTLDKTLAQQQDRVLKRWKKLITGLRIRQRLQGQFKDVESGIVGEAANLGGSAGSASGSNTGTVSSYHFNTLLICSPETEHLENDFTASLQWISIEFSSTSIQFKQEEQDD